MYEIWENGSVMRTEGGMLANGFNTVIEAVHFLEDHIRAEYPVNTFGNTYEIVKHVVVKRFEVDFNPTLLEAED